jgi:hypothetical protein
MYPNIFLLINLNSKENMSLDTLTMHNIYYIIRYIGSVNILRISIIS